MVQTGEEGIECPPPMTGTKSLFVKIFIPPRFRAGG